jgi:hypothetical protein
MRGTKEREKRPPPFGVDRCENTEFCYGYFMALMVLHGEISEKGHMQNLDEDHVLIRP